MIFHITVDLRVPLTLCIPGAECPANTGGFLTLLHHTCARGMLAVSAMVSEYGADVDAQVSNIRSEDQIVSAPY